MSLSGKHLGPPPQEYMIAASHEADSDYDASSSDIEYGTPSVGHVTHLRGKTSLSTKIRRIKEQKTVQALSKKKRVKDIKSVKDLWFWYWQHPIAHFPFIYFFVTLLSAMACTIYWFIDNDSSFILCGIIGLSMCGYASYKFKISIQLKREIDKYKRLNLQFKHENRKIEDAVNRAIKASQLLKKTKTRLAKANNKNRRNLIKFEKVEENMKVVGEKTNLKISQIHGMATQMREKWREEYLKHERNLLHAVFNRYERKHTEIGNFGMNADDFKQFQDMLPVRYMNRFDRLGTFHNFAGDKSMIDLHDFCETLDVFAEMETDDKDIYIRLTPVNKGHNRGDVSSFDFQITHMNVDQSKQSNYLYPKK